MDSFVVLKNQTYGRYAVAARTLMAGDLIHEEEPVIVGPKRDSKPLCLECYKATKDRCTKCTWPVCLECEERQVYHTECALFRDSNAVFQDWDMNEKCSQLDCVTPLRLLLKIEENPVIWEKELRLMEFHDEARRQDVSTWEQDQVNIVNYLMCLRYFGREMIERVIGILDVNCFEARTVDGYSVQCLYPKFSVVAHSCIPNSSHSIVPSTNFRLKAFATIRIRMNQPIFATYTFTLSTTKLRQIHLKKTKYFDCKCERCMCATELGTHLSSFKCTRCDDGIMLPLNPLNSEEDWRCTDCATRRYGADVAGTVAVLQKELNEILRFYPNTNCLEELNYFYDAVSNVVHADHYMLQIIRYHLILMYHQCQMTEIEMRKVINYGTALLKVLKNIEPGKTRFRAEILYYMSGAKMNLAEVDLKEERIDRRAYRKLLNNVEDELEECIGILEQEDPLSPEGLMKGKAEEKLKCLEKK